MFGFTAAVIGGLESPPGALVGGTAARARAELVSRLLGAELVTLGALVILLAVLHGAAERAVPPTQARRV